MKRYLLPLLVAITATASAQDPAAPCCIVVGVNTENNSVIARNLTSGRLFSFNADPMVLRSIKLKDPVTTNKDMSMVTAISGIARKYTSGPINDIQSNLNESPDKGKSNTEPQNGIVRINWGEPCCNIIQIDNAESCCSLVTAKNQTSGSVLQFKAPKLVLNAVKVGDPVYLEPCCNMAIIQSGYQGSGNQLNSFGYPIESGSGSNEHNSSAKWVTGPANMKGVLGRLNTAFPADVEWSVEIRSATANKFITSRSGFSKHGPFHDLAPGRYNFQLNSILVENVPIERGKETRIKSGVLHIVSEGKWQIYSEAKDKNHTSGNKPKKIALPVGSYQLKLGEQFFPVAITDGTTVEY